MGNALLKSANYWANLIVFELGEVPFEKLDT